MMRSLFSGVSGLRGHQTRMDVIGHNISNVNTVGYKASRVTFADTLYQTSSGASAPTGNLGGINPKQIGLGMNIASIDTIFGDASVQGTGKNTDVALSGNGLFVVKNSSGTYYTRDGAFEFDAKGNYVLPGNGAFVQGWMASEDGELVTTGQPGNIQIRSDKNMRPQMTTAANYLNNLNADTKGYEIASIMAKFEDGKQKSLAAYTTGSIGEITLGTSTGADVKLDDNAQYAFTTGDHLAGKALFETKVTALEAGGAGKEVTVTYQGNKQDVYDVQLVGAGGVLEPFTIKQTSGTYAIGDQEAISGTIDTNGVTTNGTEPGVTELTVTLTQPTARMGQKVKIKVPNPANFTYADGQTVNFNLSATKLEGQPGAKVHTENTFSNGKALDANEATATNAYTVTEKNQRYIYKGRLDNSDGTVNRVDRTVKQPTEVTLTMKDGQVFTGAVNGDYTVGGMFYPPSVTTFTVYDSLGGAHSIPLIFRKVGANEWDMSLAGDDTYSYRESNGMEVRASLIKTRLKFDQTGRYVSGDAAISLSYRRAGEEEPKPHSVTVSLGALTQYSGSSTIKAESDGNAEGVLKNVTIDSTGTITGVYSNGKIKAEAQIAVAQFNNASGLTRVGGNFFQQSNNSGVANVKTAANLGCTITPSAIEMSNVDIAEQFSDMIVTQRGFQANSKTITVSDEMLETLIGMKR